MGHRGAARDASRRRLARARDRISRLARVAEKSGGAGRRVGASGGIGVRTGAVESAGMRTLGFLFGALFSVIAAAQSWPQKPVRFIVPFAPCGATAIAARMLGDKLSQAWGHSEVIENRAGAGGALGAAEAVRATPHGPTLVCP